MKTFNQVRVLAIFLLVLIPFIYQYNYFEKLYDKTETANNELIKEQLLIEMDKYQDDLKPEKYIEKAFKDLEKHLNFPDLDSSQYKFTISENNEPDYINKNYIDKAKYFLKEKYGIETLLLLSSSYDFTNINLDKKEEFFLDKKNERKYLYSCIGTIIQKSFIGTYFLNILKPVNSKNTKLIEDTKISIVKESLKDKKIIDFNNTFELQTLKNISIFYKNIGKPNSCSSFYSNKFGQQLIYQYHNFLFQKENDQKVFLLGLYYTLIKSSDISINKLFANAYNYNDLNKSTSKIKRGILNKTFKSSNWDTEGDKISYIIPFPSHFYNFIQNHSYNNKAEYKLYTDYLQKHSLIVSIDKNILKNDYLFYKKLTLLIIYLLVILSLLYIVNNLFNIVNLKLSLS